MVTRHGVLTRRQFLILGGGGTAVLWAGVRLTGRSPGDAVTVGAVEESVTAPALRVPPFHDTFANAALPAWNVRRPVAVLGTTPFGVALAANRALDGAGFLRGRGTVIGLDGPLAGSSGPGLLVTIDTFAFDAGSTYALTFSVAGSHLSADRMPPSTVVAGLPGLGVSRRVTRSPLDDFRTFTLQVPVTRPATSTIVLASENAPGQAGVLLESVSLTRTG